ncbi:MAG: hypothetical protein M1170_02745, partial [Patescibacteria group bacterium]|nr:hypothetical protein [Patescibacteria group bacterium]
NFITLIIKDGEFVFINKTNEEYGRIFQDAFKEKLEEKGFVVLSIASGTKKDSNDFLLIKVSLSDKPPIIPLLTNGIVAFTAIIEKDGKILWRMDGGNFTDPPIIPVSWIVKKGTARVLTKAIMESFKVK